MKPQDVLGTEWDYLLVLDACRYDAFERVHGEYLDGRLERQRSPASSTPEWAAKVFGDAGGHGGPAGAADGSDGDGDAGADATAGTDAGTAGTGTTVGDGGVHDLAYFSANPFINDTGTPLSELPWGASCEYEWTATDSIASVVDLWREAWDDDLGTVPPESVNEAVRERAALCERHERTVVHYIQPHAPYLVNGAGYKLSGIREGVASDADGDRGGVLTRVGERLGPAVEPLLERSSAAMKLGMWLELGVGDALSLGREGTRATVERYYEQNLRRVLSAVVDLLPDLEGRVVVTADHGEAFGEQGVWEHHVDTHIPPLVEVPWFVVEDD